MNISIVIPAKNEARALGDLLRKIDSLRIDFEIIVVDDGSQDETAKIAKMSGATVLQNPQSLGNGAAIKRGFRESSGDLVVFMDADGQHQAEDIPRLLQELQESKADMVVGARNADGQANKWRHIANIFYNRFSSLVSGQNIADLTSGFRVVRSDKFAQFLNILPNGFSYPTTSTMAFFRSGYIVRYVPINVKRREGKSHIKPFRDGARFLIIIFKVATLYSPLKVFLPIAFTSFLLGLGRYIYTYIEMGQFTNMSALLMVTGVQIFLIGLVSEQITALMYQPNRE